MTQHEEFDKASDLKWWFLNQPRPIQNDFESICTALVRTFDTFPQGATIEELFWFLCLSTICGQKNLTRRSISRELSRRRDLFQNISRAKYIIKDRAATSLPNVANQPNLFNLNPFSFGNENTFNFMPNLSIFGNQPEIDTTCDYPFEDSNRENLTEDQFDPNAFFNIDPFSNFQ